MADLKSVILLGGYKSNNAGELCGFPADEADKLLAEGLARLPGDPKPEDKKPVSKAPPANKKVAKAPVEK